MCTLNGQEFAYGEKIIAKTQDEAFEKTKNKVIYEICENLRVELDK